MKNTKVKPYYVYLIFKLTFTLCFSMGTVLSLIYHIKVCNLNAFELVIVGLVLELSCFIFEIPTGVVADRFSRKLSIIIGLFLYGLGFIIEGAIPLFGFILLSQVIWGLGDTFITGALEAWILSEKIDIRSDKLLFNGNIYSNVGMILGIFLGTIIGYFSLQLPLIIAGIIFVILGIVFAIILQENNFNKVTHNNIDLIKSSFDLFKFNLKKIKMTPVMIVIIIIVFLQGLGSEGFDRLGPLYFVNNVNINGVITEESIFGIMSLLVALTSIIVSYYILKYLEKSNRDKRTKVLNYITILYISSLITFAFSKNLWVLIIFYILTSLTNQIKNPLITSLVDDYSNVELKATMFSTCEATNALGQIIGGPIVGIIAYYTIISYGLLVTALFIVPILFLILLIKRYSSNKNIDFDS